MDSKDYLGILLQNITRSLPSSKIKDYWQACDRSRGFSRTESWETTVNISLPPMNARHHFLVTKLHFLLCTVDGQCVIWTALWLSYTRRVGKGGRTSTRIRGQFVIVNRIYMYCNLVGTARFHATDTKLGISVQPNYPHTRYVGLRSTTTHPYTHTHTRAHTPKVRVYYTSAHPLTVDLLNISASSLAVS